MFSAFYNPTWYYTQEAQAQIYSFIYDPTNIRRYGILHISVGGSENVVGPSNTK